MNSPAVSARNGVPERPKHALVVTGRNLIFFSERSVRSWLHRPDRWRTACFLVETSAIRR